MLLLSETGCRQEEEVEELTVFGVETFFQALVDQRTFILRRNISESSEQVKAVSHTSRPSLTPPNFLTPPTSLFTFPDYKLRF